nr:MAG TPA: hypothetical protein [Caudoviricetes sp.]
MTEILQIIYLVCGIVAMLAAAAAMTFVSIRSAKEIKCIRESARRDAELFEYQKKVLDRIVVKKVINVTDNGEEQQSKEE